EKVPVAGKTGTAESGQQQPHAWFAEFAPVDGAKLAGVVMIEHGGEGSVTAAPLARQMVDAAVQAGIITQ
ncbi:MAG: penicillin-binding protein 2, partial [Chloroflexi bacterium]|nr:penicillin-binding protein 2 [Chloroflexota bacterium]